MLYISYMILYNYKTRKKLLYYTKIEVKISVLYLCSQDSLVVITVLWKKMFCYSNLYFLFYYWSPFVICISVMVHLNYFFHNFVFFKSKMFNFASIAFPSGRPFLKCSLSSKSMLIDSRILPQILKKPTTNYIDSFKECIKSGSQ